MLGTLTLNNVTFTAYISRKGISCKKKCKGMDGWIFDGQTSVLGCVCFFDKMLCKTLWNFVVFQSHASRAYECAAKFKLKRKLKSSNFYTAHTSEKGRGR